MIPTIVAVCTLTLTITPPSPPYHDGFGLAIAGPDDAEYTIVTTVAGIDEEPRVVTASHRMENWYLPLPGLATATTAKVVAFATTSDGVCRGESTVDIPADPRLAALAGRIVVPVAGSTNGAYGSRWRTQLRLRGFGTGRIYFRGNGTFAGNDTDPHLDYDLGPPSDEPIFATVVDDDVVASMGASGVGSLEIVPDQELFGGRWAPGVEAFLYNDGPDGRFGTDVPVLRPENLVESLEVPLDDANASSRINVGLRTFGDTVRVQVAVLSRLGGLVAVGHFDVPAHTFRQMTLQDVMLGRAVDPQLDEALLLSFGEDPVAAYFSITDNQTNDPRVRVGQRATPERVDNPVLPR